MSAKSLDAKGRWRSLSVGFRVSPEEWNMINSLVKLSGLQKQEYLISKALNREVVVKASSRTYKAFRDELAKINDRLLEITKGEEVTTEMLTVLSQIAITLNEMKENEA